MLELDNFLPGADITAVHDAYAAGSTTVADVTRWYLGRIEEKNPDLRAVITTSGEALALAKEQDQTLAAGGKPAGALFGIPILVKDNIETRDMPTTAGSLALVNNHTGRDAPCVASLRAAGAIILGKTNLSEWANFRSQRSSSGWSAVGGQCVNAHDPLRSPGGSSAGSGTAVAACLAHAALGTETNGSIISPASLGGLVGFKPAVGLVPQQGIVPISHSQDTAGPITRNAADAARLFAVMAGSADTTPVQAASLEGKRFGCIRSSAGFHEGVDALLEQALEALVGTGAVVVDDLRLDAYREFRKDALDLLLYEFKHDLNAWFATLQAPQSELTLARLIAFNEAHADQEMPYFRQELFELAEAKDDLDSADYRALRERVQAAARGAMDACLADNDLDALVAPSSGAAWTIDLVNGDHGRGGFSGFPAIAGYPHVTTPMGRLHRLPVGFSLASGPGMDRALLSLARAFEEIAR